MIVSEPIYKKSKNVMKTYTNEISLVIAAVFSNKLFLSSFQERRKVQKIRIKSLSVNNYSTVRNKRSPMLIIFWTFFQVLLKRGYIH